MRSFESIKIIVKRKKKRKEIFHMFSSISVCSSVLGFWPRIKRAMQIYVERVKCQLGRGSLPICISIRLLNARTTRLRYRSRYRILFRRREEREREEGGEDPRRLFLFRYRAGETIFLFYEILGEKCIYNLSKFKFSFDFHCRVLLQREQRLFVHVIRRSNVKRCLYS